MPERFARLIRFTITFAVGVIVGFGLFWVLSGRDGSGGPLDVDLLTGTMKSIGSASGYEEIGHLGVELDQIYGDVRVHGAKRKLVAEVDLSSLKEFQWALKYDRKEVNFDGFRQVVGEMRDMETKSGELKVSHVGRGHYIVFFVGQVDDPEPLTLEISVEGRVIYEQDLAGGSGG